MSRMRKPTSQNFAVRSNSKAADSGKKNKSSGKSSSNSGKKNTNSGTGGGNGITPKGNKSGNEIKKAPEPPKPTKPVQTNKPAKTTKPTKPPKKKKTFWAILWDILSKLVIVCLICVCLVAIAGIIVILKDNGNKLPEGTAEKQIIYYYEGTSGYEPPEGISMEGTDVVVDDSFMEKLKETATRDYLKETEETTTALYKNADELESGLYFDSDQE